MMPLFNYKVPEKKERSKTMLIVMVVLLVIVLFVSLFFAFYKSDFTTSRARTPFKEALSQVCTPSNTRLEYEGTNSFFEYLQQPHQHVCSSWIKLRRGGSVDQNVEKNDTLIGSGMDEGTDVTNWQYVCKPDVDESLQESCIVYSFTQHVQEHIEEHFQSLGCSLRVFPQQAPEELTHEPAEDSDVSVHPRDIHSKAYRYKNVNTASAEALQAQSLDDVASALGHTGQRISFVNVDAQGQEWPLLTKLVTLHDMIDVQQVSARIHLPVEVVAMSDSERHLYFSELHQIFEGLHCLGYKLTRSQPLTPESNEVTLVEVADQRYPMSYQVNWMKAY